MCRWVRGANLMSRTPVEGVHQVDRQGEAIPGAA